MDPENHIKEEILIWDQFRAGGDKAFARLFDLYSDILYRYGMKFLDNEDAVKDCVQDLFVKLYLNRATLSATDNVKLYLFRSLKNKIIDSIREEKHLVYISPQELQFSVKYYFDPEEDEENTGINQDLRDKFEKALNTLSDRQKEAIYLRYQMEMSYEEISQLLHINYQSTRNLLHRSIEKIRKEMDLKLFLFMFLKLTV